MLRLPLKYNFKSLMQRPLRSLLTLTGVGLSVFLSVMMLGLSRGLVASTIATGEELNVLVLSKGAESMEFSALDPEALHLLGNSPGVASAGGSTMASPEAYINSLGKLAGDPQEGTPVLVRGVRPEIALEVHSQVQVTEGRAPRRGYEAAVGPLVATRLGVAEDALRLGEALEIEGQRWEIVGRLSAPGTAFEAEVWTQLDDLMVAAKRDDYSALVLSTADLKAREGLLFDLQTRTDVRTTLHVEKEYYAASMKQMEPIQAVANLMTVLLIIGGLMAGMNTMFSSIMGRTREMAVLLVLGYRRQAVLASFILESVLLSLAGGALGCLAGLTLNGLPMKFSMGAFRFLVDPATVSIGMCLALVIGILGAATPVLRVMPLKTVDGLRMQA